jgi:hypothetical protein
MGNFLYPWARNKFLTQSAPLAWNNSSSYKVMFINAGVATNYVWSATGNSGYAWNPAAAASAGGASEDGTTPGSTPGGAGYAITWLSQIPTAHRSIAASYGGVAGAANTLGIVATNYGNGVANASFASTTQLAVAAGAAITAFVIYRDTSTLAATATQATSYSYESAMDLIAFFDSAIGMPVSGNGGDITIVWDTGANKIFKI